MKFLSRLFGKPEYKSELLSNKPKVGDYRINPDVHTRKFYIQRYMILYGSYPSWQFLDDRLSTYGSYVCFSTAIEAECYLREKLEEKRKIEMERLVWERNNRPYIVNVG